MQRTIVILLYTLKPVKLYTFINCIPVYIVLVYNINCTPRLQTAQSVYNIRKFYCTCTARTVIHYYIINMYSTYINKVHYILYWTVLYCSVMRLHR